MSAPEITVIVPARDAAATLPALLGALAGELAGRTDAEVVLVDSGSRDATPQLGEGAGARVVREERPGASAARNAGAAAARGEVLVFLDADCRPLPGWLGALLAPRGRAEVGAAAGAVRAAAPATLLESYAQRRDYVTQERALAHPWRPWMLTANCWYRRDAFAALGGFDPALRSGEDVDLAWRLQLELGLELAYAADAVVEHRHRSTLRGVGRQWQRYGWGSVQLEARYPEAYRAEAVAGLREGPARRAARHATKAARTLAGLPSGRTDVVDVAGLVLDVYAQAADATGRARATRAGHAAAAGRPDDR